MGALFGFRGAGGQSRILGILCSLDVGVRQQSSSSTLIFLSCVSTSLLLLLLAPILSLKPPTCGVVDDDVVRVVLTVSSLVLDLERSCKNSRSVDMVLVLCTRGRFCVCELNGNRGERCGVACYICRRKKKKIKRVGKACTRR